MFTKNEVFCAFCKISHRVYERKHLGWPNVGLAFLTSILTMFIIWQSFDPRFLVIFVLYLAVAEAFVQIRWRLSLNCPHCGFDPVLYLQDSSQAEARVKSVLAAKKESGDYLMSTKNPFENLPKIEKSVQDKLSQLSKRV